MNKKILIIALLLALVAGLGYWWESKNINFIKFDNKIDIGVITPLTGDFANYGVSIKNGLELALDEINSKSIKKISLTFEDSKSQTTQAVNAFEKLITVDKIKVILGPFSSSDVLAAAPIAEKNKIILFTTSASSPSISKAGDYIFRNVPSDNLEAGMMANFLIDSLGYKENIAVFSINSEYGQGVTNTFTDILKERGVKNIDIISYNEGLKDFRTLLTKVKSKPPTAIYLVGYKEMGLILKQLRELGIKCPIFSTALFEDNDILKTAGSASNGVVFTSITFDSKNTDYRSQQFAKNYEIKYKSIPDGFAAVAYDALYILQPILDECGSVNTDCIKEKLYKVSNFKGLLGSVKIDTLGDVVLPIKLKKIKDNKIINY